VLGDAQFYRGYCILLAKHHAREIFELPRDEARALFDEIRSVAEAINTVVKPLKLNYECLGNLEPHIHWHVFPRFASEEESLRLGPVWVRPASERMKKLEEHDERALIASLRAEIVRLMPTARTPLD
ncbi:MAG TPA: HIT domain-containing protein, partial [Candidatus Binataceae bacterium]|nr:HIT domain-containing protein [Candidatus Binataceae bacterium]